MQARPSSPRNWRREISSVLVASVLIAGFLAWRGQQQPSVGGSTYFDVEALDDGAVLLLVRHFERDEVELRLVRGESTLWTHSMTLADAASVGGDIVSTAEYIAVPFSATDAVEYHVLRRSDGASTGTFRVAPGLATRAVYGQRLVSLQSVGSGVDYDIHDLARPEAPAITRSLDCMTIAEPFATSSRLLLYSGVATAECSGVMLGDQGEPDEDTELGPWNHTESPWPIAVEPGTDRLLVRSEDAIEAWDLVGGAEPERIALVPPEIRELRLLGEHAHRLVLAGHEGDPTWVDGVGHPPRVALVVVDAATRSIAVQTSLAPFAFQEHDRTGPTRELPRFALVQAQPSIHDETERRALLVMIDVTTGEESWRTDEMLLPEARPWMSLVRSVSGSVLLVPRESSVVIARFAGATGWLDRAVEVSGASLMGGTSTNDEVVALAFAGDRPGWILLSTETLDVVATSFDDAERDQRLADGRAVIESLVPLPPDALNRSASLDGPARRTTER
jgi:hypothetical protein